LAITDCLNFGNPEKPEIMWQFVEAVDGMAEACRQFETPVVGGNVSFYNETKGEGIKPSPVIGMIGIAKSVDKLNSIPFNKPSLNVRIYYLCLLLRLFI
jgi:phosphoribosylformylglycinamidine synthase